MRQCDEVQENIAAYVDGQLEEEARAAVQSHLAQCSACREEVEGQAAIKRQLQGLSRRQSRTHPPSRIWAQASREWDRIDGLRWRRYQLQFVCVLACLLLLCFGVVWARLTATHDFPESAAIHDFISLRTHTIKPEFATTDPDAAAKWLRDKLHAALPPIDLSLSRAELVGADTVMAPPYTIGRLLYRTPHGLIGIYIAPSGTQFPDLPTAAVEATAFRVDISHKGIGFYGWQAGRTGYGLTTASASESPSILLDAQRETQGEGN